MSRRDLDCRQNIDSFVDSFYQKVLSDDRLAPLFIGVANIDLAVHLPHIKDYWCKLLLGDSRYQRHTMNIHRQLHSRYALSPQDFRHWLQTFEITLDEGFFGPKTDQARNTARSIAKNMEKALCGSNG
jgi:hemoglobin